jgi:hypothetical protein
MIISDLHGSYEFTFLCFHMHIVFHVLIPVLSCEKTIEDIM